MNNSISVPVRCFPVLIRDERSGAVSADMIVLTREQLRAAQLVGQSSTELIGRIFGRRGFRVLNIQKPIKREIDVLIYANERSVCIGGSASLEGRSEPQPARDGAAP